MSKNTDATEKIVREAVPNAIERQIAHFYGGMRCVVLPGDVPGCPHHLNGKSNESVFPNLLPLNLELHNNLKRKGIDPTQLRKALRPDSLKIRAEEHFKTGHVPKAYGCLRLAHAMCAHFYLEDRREMELELSLITHCLYYLRRAIGIVPINLVCDILESILLKDIQSTLDSRSVLPNYELFSMLIELASWLNEFGEMKLGLDLLRNAQQKLVTYKKFMRPMDISRFERQLANGLIQSAQHGQELESALALSAECDAKNENNIFALYTVKLNNYISQGFLDKAIEALDERFAYFEKITDYCFGPLTGIDVTIQTAVGYIVLDIMAESCKKQTMRRSKKVETRISALRTQEQRYGVLARINRIPNLDSRIKQSIANVPALDGFWGQRVYPIIPNNSEKLIIETANKIYSRV